MKMMERTGPPCGPTLALHRAAPAATSVCVWADGTRFRVWAFTPEQWESIPESIRPDGWLDDTGTTYIAFTDESVTDFGG